MYVCYFVIIVDATTVITQTEHMNHNINMTTEMTNFSTETVNAETPGPDPPPHYVLLSQFICYQLLGIPISTMGIIGNIICIYVWTRKSMQWGCSSTSYYLVALAFTDLSYLLIMSFFLLLPRYLRYVDGHFMQLLDLPHSMEIWFKMAAPVSDVFANFGVFTVVAFTIERYIAITFPLRGMIMCTPKRARCILAIGLGIVTILHIPDLLEQLPEMHKYGYSENSLYKIGYNWGVMVTLFAAIPLLTLIIFNLLLVRSVIKSEKIRHKLAAATAKKDSIDIGEQKSYTVLTGTVISVVIIFLICHAPAGTILCITTYRQQMQWMKHTEQHRWDIAYIAANLLAMLNSSLNFIIYSLLSTKFRSVALHLLLPCKAWYKKKRQSHTIVSESHCVKNRNENIPLVDETAPSSICASTKTNEIAMV